MFDTQVPAFNLVDRWGPESSESLNAARLALAREVREYLLGRVPAPAHRPSRRPYFSAIRLPPMRNSGLRTILPPLDPELLSSRLSATGLDLVRNGSSRIEYACRRGIARLTHTSLARSERERRPLVLGRSRQLAFGERQRAPHRGETACVLSDPRAPFVWSSFVASAVALAGCGYHVVGRTSQLPPGIQTIAVPVFVNRTSNYRIEQRLTDAVVHELLARTKYRVVAKPESADAVMRGEVSSIEGSVVVFDSSTGRATTLFSYSEDESSPRRPSDG